MALVNLFKVADKQTDMRQIFAYRRIRSKKAIEAKLDELIQLLAESDLTGKETHDLSRYFNNSIENIAKYRDYITRQPLELSRKTDVMTEEMGILIQQVKKKQRVTENTRKSFPAIVRIIISVLLITLGFAMIILPAPPYFEIYTIFYFNEQDGFTVMDLISLIIVFCGVFALIASIQKEKE
jgi:hypothetical protein